MSLQSFYVPLHASQLLKAGNFVYMVKLKGSSRYRETVEHGELNQEMEEIIRTVLGNLDNLQPFTSTHCTVFPYKKRWEGASRLMCQRCHYKMSAYPYSLNLYLEPNTANGRQDVKRSRPDAQQTPSVSGQRSKRLRRDSPLEDAIIKDLIEELAADSMEPGPRAHADGPRAGGAVQEDTGPADETINEEEASVDVLGDSRTPGEVHPGTNQDMEEEEQAEEEEEEEEEDEEGEDTESETSERPGLLARLARRIFPLSLFYRDA